MTDLDMLIETANRLCNNLDIASQNEKRFNLDICIEFDKYSWEVYKMMNDIKQIKEYCMGTE